MYSNTTTVSFRSSHQTREKKKQENYLSTAFGSFLLIIVVELIWPNVIPFTLFQFWYFKGSLGEVLGASWPIFVWGIGVTLIAALLRKNDWEMNRQAERILVAGCLISAFAGIFEEIAFRWLIFFSEIIGYKILNWLLFGWAGFGLFEWLYLNIEAPIANFFTLGYLQPYLFNGLGWAVGAALLTSNGKFRDGHLYNGFLGWINSWFIGMFFFYLMFQYGLLAAILIHFLYDMFIFVVVYIDAAIERALGWA